jgi:prepilin-type N-terminal cleavage/methylation domain-containing protein
MQTIHTLKQSVSQKLAHRFKVGTAGFTLVELMVVLSIMSLLSSIIFASTQYARAKAVDSAQVQAVKQINTAIQAKILATGSAPANPLDGQSGCSSGTACVAYSSGTDSGAIAGDGKNAFNEVMQQLVNEGYLTAIPTIPNKNASIGYYNFGPGNPAGAVVFGSQKLATPSITGPANTCRLMIGTDTQQQQQQQSQTKHTPAPKVIAQNPLVSVANAETLLALYTVDQQFPAFTPAQRQQMQTLAADYQQACYMNGDQGCFDGDPGDENEEFPTCSSEYENTSYCTCAPY